MVAELFTEKRTQMQNWMWRQRLERAQGMNAGLLGDGQKLHFLLGVAGSGAGHLARMVSRPGLRVRFYNSLLARFEPKLVLSKTGDRLALPYQRTLDRLHPLNRIYRMLEEGNEWATLRISNRLDESDVSAVPSLIKESHALLATEGLLDELKAKALLYVGDPVKSVDWLFEQWGLDTPYLEIEGRSVLAPYFLARFMRRDYVRVIKTYRKIRHIENMRKRTILHRVLVVALIQHMFRMLALSYPQQATLVEYDQLEQRPGVLLDHLQRLMGEPGEAIARKVLATSTIVPVGRSEAIWENAWPHSASQYDFLTEKEVDSCYRMLRRAGLGVGLRERDREPPPSEKSVENVYAEFLKASNG